MKNIALVVIVAMFCAMPLQAQCLTRHRVVNAVQVVEVTPVAQVVTVVQTPVAIPVLIPATVFQYMPAFSQQPTQVSQPQTAAPDIDKIVKDRVDAILREKFGTSDGPPPLIMPGLPAAPATTTDNDVTQKAAEILANNCAQCHTTGVKTSGGVSLFTKTGDDLEFRPSVNKATIMRMLSRTASGGPPLMPPAARTDPKAAVSGQDLVVLQQWAVKP